MRRPIPAAPTVSRPARVTASSVVVALLMALLAGCGAGETVGPAAAAVPITHKYGTVMVPPAPQRIVALSLEEDLLAQVGVRTVGHADNAFAPGRPYPWQEGTVDLSGSVPVVGGDGQVDLEKVAALRPDLILATNFYNNDEFYPQLSKIAPTVAFESGFGQASWQQTSTVIGRAVGREAQVRDVVARTESYLAGLKAALPGLEGTRYAAGYYYQNGTFQISASPTNQSSRLRGEIGLRLSPALTGAFPGGRGTLPIERIGLLDSDLLLVGFASPELAAGLQAEPLYRNLSVVRAGRVATVDSFAATASNNPTTLNIPWQLENLRPVLERVGSPR